MVKIEKVYDVKFFFFIIPFLLLLSILNVFMFLKGTILLAILFPFLLLLGYLFVYCGLSSYYSKKGRILVKNIINCQNQSSDENHNAIILLNSEINTSSFWGGIDVLINAFGKKECKYRIYCCNSIGDVDTILKNPHATSIWLFGHGWRGGFSLYKKKNLIEYITLKEKVERSSYIDLIKKTDEYPKKEFIAQFHCNHTSKNRSNISLPELLLIDSSDYRNSYVSNYKMTPFSTVLALKNKVIDRIKCPS